jgi:hypothetical protein
MVIIHEPLYFRHRCQKSLRAAGLPVGLPQAQTGRQPAAQQPLPFDRFAIQRLRSPEESLHSLFKVRENASPKAFSLTAVSEPDPIYPYVPFIILTSSI